MPNINALFKSEVARLVRKELRAELQAIKKTTGAYRSEIAALKRRTQALEKQLGRVQKTTVRRETAESEESSPAQGLRFSAKGFASLRRRLDLSAGELGLLLGVSGQSIYKWEDGRARPRARHLPVIAALRKAGKKDVEKHLAAVR
jgi:DNA-binding transcriptional regulator YiaG